MESSEILSLANLLEEVKNKTDRCLNCNECARNLLDKICSILREDYRTCFTYVMDDFEAFTNALDSDIGSYKVTEELESLKNILLEKLRENSRLQMLNERLMVNCQQKAQKVKDVTRTTSQQSPQSQKARSKEISSYRDIIGRHNVEIQKLKKQISLETKKLQNERTRMSKLGKSINLSEINQGALSVAIDSSCDKLRQVEKQKRTKSKSDLFKELDERHIKKTLKLINENDEVSLQDETLDLPENFDFEPDESSEEAFKRCNDADM